MSMMSELHAGHHVAEMSAGTAAGLQRLLDPERRGRLDAGELAALTTSPLLRPWAQRSAASFGMFAYRELQEGREVKLSDWFAELRPEIRAIAAGRRSP